MEQRETEKTHEEFVNRVNRGEIIIGVDLAAGRRFFMSTPTTVLQEAIGETLTSERFWVNLCMVIGFILLIGSSIACGFALKWFSFIAIPLMLLVAFSTSTARNTILFSIILIVASGLLAFFLRGKGWPMILWLVSLPWPHFFFTLMYKLTRNFLRRLTIRNDKAFTILLGTVVFLKET